MAVELRSTVWSRLLKDSNRPMRRAVAEYILGVRFSDADNARIHFLADRCQLGTLTPLEKSEYQELVEAGMLLSV